MCTVTGLSPQPFAIAAAATATALEPEAEVSPAPRSQTRTVTSCGPSTRTSCTFVRSGKRSCVSIAGPRRSSSSRLGLRRARRRAGCRPRPASARRARRRPRASPSRPPRPAPTAHRDVPSSSMRAGTSRSRRDAYVGAPAALGEPSGRDPRCRCPRTPPWSRPGSRSPPPPRLPSTETTSRTPSEPMPVADVAQPLRARRAAAELAPRPAGSCCRARATSRISSATSSAGRSASTITMPGIRRIHLRWYAA